MPAQTVPSLPPAHMIRNTRVRVGVRLAEVSPIYVFGSSGYVGLIDRTPCMPAPARVAVLCYGMHGGEVRRAL